MKVRSDLKWIPSIDLESVNPNCTKRYCYKSLSDIHSDKNYLNKTKDSRSRSCVSLNSVREESAFSILDIINEFAPSHNVECGEHDLYPSKARSQRWKLSRKPTKLSPSLWRNTRITINTQQITLNNINTSNNNDVHESIMDDLWFAAGKTLELPPSPPKPSTSEHKESEYDEEQIKDCNFKDEQECKYEYNDNDNDHNNKKELIIANIINNLISVPFDDQPLLTSKKDTLQIPTSSACDMADGVTTRSSSLGSEAEINDNGENTTNYSANLIYSTEPSLSYIIDDVNTPIPPNDTNNTNNTSALYEFLFDGVDTDTDDDDFFGTTMIEMNYRKSVPFDTNANDKASILPLNHDAGATLADTDDKGTANEKVEQEHQQNPKPSTYVACRPLWELTQR